MISNTDLQIDNWCTVFAHVAAYCIRRVQFISTQCLQSCPHVFSNVTKIIHDCPLEIYLALKIL